MRQWQRSPKLLRREFLKLDFLNEFVLCIELVNDKDNPNCIYIYIIGCYIRFWQFCLINITIIFHRYTIILFMKVYIYLNANQLSVMYSNHASSFIKNALIFVEQEIEKKKNPVSEVQNFVEYLNSWLRSSTKSTKISIQRILMKPQYICRSVSSLETRESSYNRSSVSPSVLKEATDWDP
jgi:hypothetical protein